MQAHGIFSKNDERIQKNSKESEYQMLAEGKELENYAVFESSIQDEKDESVFFQYGEPNFESYDWKLHISVNPKQIPHAYDAIADVLKKHFHCFKVTKPNYPNDQRHYHGAQITIYLSEEWEDEIEKLNNIIKELDEILLKNHIESGVIPKSDAAIVASNYISLRNDGTKTFEHEFSLHGYHFHPLYVGSHYNPLNNLNPYQTLLKPSDDNFDLIKHFNQFEVSSLLGLYQALAWSSVAYLNHKFGNFMDNYEEITKVMENQLFEFKCLDSDEENTEELDLPESQTLMAFILMQCFFGFPNEEAFENLATLSLHNYYPHDDELGKFLSYIDKIKTSLPKFQEENAIGMTNRCLYPILGMHFSNSVKEALEQWKDTIEQINNLKQNNQKSSLKFKL